MGVLADGFFFFQAEDGIRDGHVTGVQTCALPICVLAAGDAHIYLTVPFVLGWSMMDALACGAVVIGSDTAPVREMITPGENGFLADFFDPEAIADRTTAVLRDPAAFAPIRRNAVRFIRERYSLERVLPRMVALYRATARRRPARHRSR